MTAAKVTLVNRVNQIYNDDLAIRLVLVDGNDELNFSSADFPPNGGYHTPGLQCGGPCYPGVDSATPGEGNGTGEACDVQTIVRAEFVRRFGEDVAGPPERYAEAAGAIWMALTESRQPRRP